MNKKPSEVKKSPSQELMDLKIEIQVIKKQLFFMRDMLDNILDDVKSREELIIKYVKRYYAGFENLKRCSNCQKIGNWSESFCSDCLSTAFEEREKENIPKVKEAEEGENPSVNESQGKDHEPGKVKWAEEGKKINYELTQCKDCEKYLMKAPAKEDLAYNTLTGKYDKFIGVANFLDPRWRIVCSSCYEEKTKVKEESS